MIGGYEDANDSNQLRHDPIYKIVCGRLPKTGVDLLASQPTISWLENHPSKSEVSSIRRAFIESFMARYQEPPKKIGLDIDGWDVPTHGQH